MKGKIILKLLFLLVCCMGVKGLRMKSRQKMKSKMSISQKTDALSVLKSLENMIRNQQDQSGDKDNTIQQALKGLQSIIPAQFSEPKNEKGEVDATQPMLVLQNDLAGETVNLQTMHDLEFEQECKIKQGFMVEVTDQQQKQGRLILTGRPVFAVLNSHTLSLFQNENVNSLVKTIDISHIKPLTIPKKYKDLFCWNVVNGEDSEKLEEKTEEEMEKLGEQEEKEGDSLVLGTLCSQTKQGRGDWMRAIRLFHNCDIELVPYDDGLKQKMMAIRRIKQQEKDTKDEMEREEEEENALEDSNIDTMLNKLKLEIKEEQAEKDRDRRANEGEDAKLARRTEELQDEMNCLQKTLQMKAFEEERQAELMIKTEQTDKDKALFNKMQNSLRDQFLKERSMIKRRQDELLENEKNMQRELRNMMVQQVVNYEKVIDPSMCYNEAVRGFDAQGIRTACGQMVHPGPDLDVKFLTNCLTPEYFCAVCCEYNIGASKELEREKCEEHCQSQTSQSSEGYVVTIPSENILKTTDKFNSNGIKQERPM